MAELDDLKTTGQIADELREPLGRVTYIVDKYRIKPARRVGITRLFDQQAVNRIRQGLYDIQLRG